MPTFVSLKTLTDFSSVDAVMAHIHGAQTDIFETRFIKKPSGFVTLWKPDAAYDTDELEAEGPRHRLICHQDGWYYERS